MSQWDECTWESGSELHYISRGLFSISKSVNQADVNVNTVRKYEVPRYVDITLVIYSSFLE